MMNMHLDERGILVSSFARIVIFLSILGVALFDAGVLAVNFFRLDGIARDAAVEIADLVDDGTISHTDTFNQKRTARRIARREGARVSSVEVEEDGTVVVTLRREAPTILVRRIGPLRDYGRMTATARANTP